MKKRLYLIFSRKMWELQKDIYPFTKEQLDEAEKTDSKFIGTICNVDCYLTRLFK